MHDLKCRPGVILTEIHGVYLLAADREARAHCPYLREINELGAFIWSRLSEGVSRDEMIDLIRQEFEVPEDTDLGTDLDEFIESLKEDHYISQ